MAIEFNCPDCNKLLRTSDDKAGRTANCPACGSVVSVPRVELDNVDISSDDIYGDDADEEQTEDRKAKPPATGKGDFDSVFSTSAIGSTGYQQDDDELDEYEEDGVLINQTETCPMCGTSISATARKCSRCGEYLSDQQSTQEAYHYAPHRGGLILGLGIASFFTCCIFLGVASWVMGNEDIREIDAGRMDPAGRDFIQTGRILGIISVVLQAGGFLFFCCLGLFA